jgi:hypothetical protein
MEREEGEPQADFDARLHAALGRLSPEGTSETVVVLVTSPRTTTEACATRCRLAASLMLRLREIGGGKLVVTRGYGRSDNVRGELSLLTEELADEFEGSGIQVVLRNPPQARPAAIASPFAGYMLYGASATQSAKDVRSAPYSSVRPVAQDSAA